MVKVQIKTTGEIKEVTKNIAHGLIDRGVARLYKKSRKTPKKVYKPERDKMLSPTGRKGYKVK